ncbi:MAG: lactate utilization protein [Pseudomonadota bacterium]
MNDAEVKQWHYQKHAEKIIEKMEKKGFKVQYVNTGAEAKDLIMSLIPQGATVVLTGSQTLEQIGVKLALRQSDRYKVIDPFEPGIERAENLARRRRGMTAEVMLSSTNALTEDGALVNVDGAGNRVAGMMFGPDKVILAVGMNKVQPDLETAWERIRQIARPMNNKRLQLPNPCTETGYCQDCSNKTRICNCFTVIERCFFPDRIHVVLIGEDLGY